MTPRRPLDTTYLDQHGRQRPVRVKVPNRARPEPLGELELVVQLHTEVSLAIANRDKHKHVHALKQCCAAAEVELDAATLPLARPPVDPLVSEDWHGGNRSRTRPRLEMVDRIAPTTSRPR